MQEVVFTYNEEIETPIQIIVEDKQRGIRAIQIKKDE